MADPTVLNALPWPLPRHPRIRDALVARWEQPQRRYHDLRHLAECLQAAQHLRAGPEELFALWFHDAVHTNTPGGDEAASAALAEQLLAPLLSRGRVAEVMRLVLLTEHHQPARDDPSGAVVADADLWVLGAQPPRYAESVRDLRWELGLDEPTWRSLRRPQLAARLAGPIYHTPAGLLREPAARRNLVAELRALSGTPG